MARRMGEKLVKVNMSINNITDNQLDELKFVFNMKKSQTASHILEQYIKDNNLKKEFFEYKEYYNRLVSIRDKAKLKKLGITKTSIIGSYQVPPSVKEQLDSISFEARYSDVSRFFRTLVSFFYDKYITKIEKDIKKIESALNKIGYKVIKTAPLDDNIAFLVKRTKKNK